MWHANDECRDAVKNNHLPAKSNSFLLVYSNAVSSNDLHIASTRRGEGKEHSLEAQAEQ